MTNRTPRVLVADDDAVALLVAQAALEDAGFEVLGAEDGSAAVALFAQQNPDCVILDVMMPGMDGYEACRTIRATPAGGDTPILIMTSRDDLDAVVRAYESGATDFTSKGISSRLLIERVRFLLRESRSRRELVVSRGRLRMVQEMTQVGHWEVDGAGRTIHVSRFVRSLLPERVGAGSHLAQLVSALRPEDGRGLLEAFRGWQESRAPFRFEAEMRSGQSLHIQGALTPGVEAAGAATLTLAVQDISTLRRAQQQAYRLANFDSLTGLPNRMQFADALAGQLQDRKPGTQLALLVFRLRGLERLQQSLGQAACDAALISTTQLILDAITRGADAAFAHLGGGEFAFFSSGCDSPALAAGAAENIARVLANPVTGQGWTANFLVSTGIVMWPADGQDAATLLENARTTAARGLSADKSHYEFFKPEVQQRALRLINLESALHGAMERGELSLAYQPRIGLADRALRGAEALLRWNHPELGPVAPGEFIPIAENCGLITAIGSWVLHEAARQVVSWRAKFGLCLPVSVNVSAQQLRAPRALVEDVLAALRSTGLPGSVLTLELTESMMISATAEALAALKELRSLGISIALDDFGTGYSSLGYLRRLPVDCLKIDQSFVSDLSVDEDAERVLQAILGIASALRLSIVAEGIETEAQLEALCRHGCQEGQGFLLARPLAVPAFEALLAESVSIGATGTSAAI
jgi:predicted signal transduction protein with EAL and GGDEF domain/AmiR/NasT family two-component response regulator